MSDIRLKLRQIPIETAEGVWCGNAVAEGNNAGWECECGEQLGYALRPLCAASRVALTLVDCLHRFLHCGVLHGLVLPYRIDAAWVFQLRTVQCRRQRAEVPVREGERRVDSHVERAAIRTGGHDHARAQRCTASRQVVGEPVQRTHRVAICVFAFMAR